MRILSFVLETMIYIGIGLPIVNLLLGFISSGGGDGGGDVDVDAGPDLDMDADIDLDADAVFELDVGDASADPDISSHSGGKNAIGFNLYCLCLAFVILGAVGSYGIRVAQSAVSLGLFLFSALLMAVAAYCAVYYCIIRVLKNNDAPALKMDNLRGQTATVVFRITSDSPGQIQAHDAVGALITYRAELAPETTVQRVEEGQLVTITEVDKKNQVCIVCPRQTSEAGSLHF